MRTDPAEGTTPIGGEIYDAVRVTYWVSTGPKVPSIVGENVTIASVHLALKHFRLGEVTRIVADGTPGTIVSQSPEAGSYAEQETPIDVQVVQEWPTVPQVVGKTEAQAAADLQDFTPSNQGVVNGPQVAGIVLRTEPAAGQRAKPGSPVGYWLTSGQNVVPDLRSRLSGDATQLLARDGFVLGTQSQRIDLGDPNRIIDQTPKSGQLAKVGSAVDVWIAINLLVPQIVGRLQPEATQALHALGLVAAPAGQTPSLEPKGTVLDSDPAANTRVLAGATVRFRVASGQYAIPDLSRLRPEQARAKLQAVQFELGGITSQPADGAQDIVLDQSPKAEALANLGSRVDIVVSSDFPIVPNVVDTAQDEAEGKLRDAHLAPQLAGREPDRHARGTVLRTEPEVGQKVRTDPPIVRFWVASGDNVVPSLGAMTTEDAQRAAGEAGFRVGGVTYDYSADQVKRVIRQDPAQGTLRPLNDAIAIVLGSDRRVPNVVDMTKEDAQSAIAAANMTTIVQERMTFGGGGKVIAQSPAGGVLVATDVPVAVTLTVAKSVGGAIAGSALIVLLAGAWWTQLRPWPAHWPPPMAARVELSLSGDGDHPADAHVPLDADANVRIHVELEQGEPRPPDAPLPIVRTENPHG